MSSTSKASSSCQLMSCLASNDLLKWTDQKKSGAIFSSGLLGLYLLQNYTLLGLLAYTLLYATSLCSTWVLIKNVIVAFQANQNGAPQNNPHPFQSVLDYIPKKINFNEEQMAKFAKKLTAAVNKSITCFVDLVLAKSISNSLMFATILWFTSGILARFEFLCLCMISWVGLFTIPMLYKMKQAEIDGVIAKVWAPIEPHYVKIQSMIMKYKNASNSLNKDSDEDKSE